MTAMSPMTLPSKTPAEAVSVYLQLSQYLNADTITGTPTFASDPAGLVFSYQSAIDAAQTAAALVSGGVANTTYTLSATCQLASGQVLQPVVALPVVEPFAETRTRRPVML